jgi:hypothetical protein
MTAHELESIMNQVQRLSPYDRLQLIKLIVENLAQEDDSTHKHNAALDLLEEFPGGRLFKTSDEADEYLREERDSWDR